MASGGLTWPRFSTSASAMGVGYGLGKALVNRKQQAWDGTSELRL